MHQTLDAHFDILVVSGLAVLLIAAYVTLLLNGIDSKGLELMAVSAVSGAIGMGRRKAGTVSVEGDDTEVTVKEAK